MLGEVSAPRSVLEATASYTSQALAEQPFDLLGAAVALVGPVTSPLALVSLHSGKKAIWGCLFWFKTLIIGF